MDKYGIILLFLFMSVTGFQIFKRDKMIHKIGGIFWMVLGTGGAIMMIIKLLK